MPSFHRTTAVALAAIIPLSLAGTPETCTNTQVSCQGSSTNTCCFNTPGGLFQQVQFWDTNPATGPSTSWTIHGLWPNNCDGTYSEDCDESRAYTNITQLLEAAGDTSTLDYMQTYWVSDDESNEAFWDHEWETHGTCVSTLNPDCYTGYTAGEEAVDFFTTAVSLFKTLPTYTVGLPQFPSQLTYTKHLTQWLADAGITPSSSKTYQLSAMNSALESAFGAPVILQCDDSDVVYEIYYAFNVNGSLQTGTFEPTTNTGSTTNCPSTVKYPPK
jgi:ribonuclease T2